MSNIIYFPFDDSIGDRNIENLYAFYIGDFRFPDYKIGELIFKYNSKNDRFEMTSERELSYTSDIVIEDTDFIIFETKPSYNEESAEVYLVDREELKDKLSK